MNNTRQIKKLTRKYFWQEKKKEICEHFEDYWGNYFITMIVFGIMFQFGWVVLTDTTHPVCKPLAIIGLCLVGVWAFIGLIALIVIILGWIISNWEKAKLKAIQDVKKMKKGGKK